MIGAVLIGGRGRRIGGDKPWVTVEGRPLVEWAVRLLRRVGCEEVYAVAPVRDARWDGPVIRDEGVGPAGGVRAVLRAFDGELVCVTACDVAFDPEAFARCDPVPRHVRGTLFPMLLRADGRAPRARSVRGLLRRLGSTGVEVPAVDADRPEDLRSYRALLRRVIGRSARGACAGTPR
ncbi:MAG: molybdenum cofactor guanylyltransferase [Methanopyraceae archaeon]